MSPNEPASPPSSSASTPATNEQPASRPSTTPAERGDDYRIVKTFDGDWLLRGLLAIGLATVVVLLMVK